MMLPLIPSLLFFAGFLSCGWPFLPKGWGRIVSLLSIVLTFIVALSFYPEMNGGVIQWKIQWIRTLNINFHLAMSPISFWLVVLTLFMGFLAVITSDNKESNSYYAAISWTLMATVGIFLAQDIFLFFMSWEIALLPVYFLLAISIHSDNKKTLLRYVVYTQISGLLLLLSIVALVIAHFNATGILTFNYNELKNVALPDIAEKIVFTGFILAFAFKLPLFPFHSWLPSIIAKAPAPIILIAILIKTSLYGLWLFSWPLFFKSCAALSIPLMGLGFFSMIYGATRAFSQTNPKKVIAFGTLSHVGFIFMGIMSPSHQAFLGVAILMIAQALSTGALVLLLDKLARQNSLWSLDEQAGLFSSHARFSSLLFIFLLASIGTPMFGNFIGEWLVLMAIYNQSMVMAILASSGIVLSAAYSLWLFHRLCFGESKADTYVDKNIDLKQQDILLYGALAALLLILGLYPAGITNMLPSNSPHDLGHSKVHHIKTTGAS